MYNWLKTGILLTGLLVGSIPSAFSQTYEDISHWLHAEDNTTNTYSLADAILEGLKNNGAQQVKVLQIQNDSLGLIITKHDRRSIKLNSHGGAGFDPYPNIANNLFGNQDIGLRKPYFEIAVSMDASLLNPDTKYRIAIAKTTGEDHMIGLEYVYTSVVTNIINQYYSIQAMRKNIVEYKNQIALIDTTCTNIKDPLLREKLQPKLESEQLTLQQEETKLASDIQTRINNFYQSLGKYSTAKLVLTDTLFMPSPDLFDAPRYDTENPDFLIDSLAIPSAIIRTQSERLLQKNAIYELLIKSNIEFTLGFSLPVRNTVIPTPYFGTPIGLTFGIKLFGNSTKQKKQQALNTVLSYQTRIKTQTIALANSMNSSFNKLQSRINLTDPTIRDAYKKELENLLQEVYQSTQMDTARANNLALTLPLVIKSHYDARRSHNTYTLEGIYAASAVRAGMLFESKPTERIKEIEEKNINFEYYLTGSGKIARQRFRELKKIMKKDMSGRRKWSPFIPQLKQPKGFRAYERN